MEVVEEDCRMLEVDVEEMVEIGDGGDGGSVGGGKGGKVGCGGGGGVRVIVRFLSKQTCMAASS